jgi:glycosyltransferase involved in cell wall biosynthesis
VKVAINALPAAPGMTGIGGYAQDLVRSTIACGRPHEYLYLTGPRAGALPLAGREDLRQAVVNPSSPLWEHLHLPALLASHGVDLYHSPLFTCPIVDEVPSVITIHDLIPETHPHLCSPKFLEFYRAAIGPSLRAAARIVTTSESAKKDIVARLGVASDRVEAIYQGISPEYSPGKIADSPRLRARWKLPGRYLLYVGMVEPPKPPPRLVAAFGEAAPRLPGVGLVIAGRKDDPAYSLRDEIGASGAADRIVELGYVPAEDLTGLYAGAHAFVFPSLCEGFGRPVVEAMASGVPVVASNATSLPEIAGDAALLVPPEDVDALAEALLRVCGDEAWRRESARRGLARAQEFTWAKFGERLARFYSSLEGVQ